MGINESKSEVYFDEKKKLNVKHYYIKWMEEKKGFTASRSVSEI